MRAKSSGVRGSISGSDGGALALPCRHGIEALPAVLWGPCCFLHGNDASRTAWLSHRICTGQQAPLHNSDDDVPFFTIVMTIVDTLNGEYVLERVPGDGKSYAVLDKVRRILGVIPFEFEISPWY